ncbi:3-keto-5-aminohexanoate cleavage protein [Clostridium thailandense]|uniref:3-keto-5-aminohexanoate cleavage protein n=1 Tax=Clostridium thailandense TaxID=2794346 RepID=A0A949WTY7_9CLOT|nr:3-keto-5-aminohexanoate cleavage protein [Clostridium thailandense]MBV7276741.1 3-keto-5-aminohexanoate cleavage protein [Clostridium thailandense]
MSDLSKKRVISVAITGSWPTREDNPNLSITPQEIAEDVYASWKAGAAIAHIHVRNDDGSPSTDFKKYKETIDLIRAKKDCDICINITSSGSVDFGDEERIYPLQQLLPELASYDAGTLNWQHRTVFYNPPQFLEKLGHALQESNIKPEIEIFDAGMVYNAIHYIKTGVLKAPCHFQIVLGAAGGMTNTIENLVHLKNILPEGSTWGACGIGKGHMPIMLATIAMGGHLRVGMEDNVMYHKGVLAESNAQFVARAKRLLEEAGFDAATPDEARQIYGLTRKVF